MINETWYKGPEGAFAGCLVGDELIGFGYLQLAFPHARRD